jgi:DNA adenine methylase
VNVASVPQRSPFRYPGGKTWLVPRIRSWLTSQPKKPHELIEPFAGGGIVSLTAIFENLVDCVTMVELDEEVAAVWKTVLSEDAAWLAQRIVTFSFTPESVHAELARPAHSLRDRAFQTLLRNRVNRGGILAPGSGRLKHGENGKGLASRWYPQTLKKRILPIAALRDRIRFIHGDGLQVLRDNAARSDVLFFIDPPYTVAGKKAGSRLYTHNEIDHEELFCIAEKLAGDFLMTYDNTEAVREMAAKHGFASLAVPMKTTHHAALTERLIGRDLRWT